MTKPRQAKARMKREYRKVGRCDSCGERLPLVTLTHMCGPCTYGDASTLLNEYDEVPVDD